MPTKTIQQTKGTLELELEMLYQSIKDMRTQKSFRKDQVESIYSILKEKHPNDWLLNLELLELSKLLNNNNLTRLLTQRLLTLKEKQPKIAHLIQSGIDLL